MAPSTRTLTEEMGVPMDVVLSIAPPEMTTFPETAAPRVGLSIFTVGAGAAKVTTPVQEPETPALSVATARNEWDPSEKEAVFSE